MTRHDESSRIGFKFPAATVIIIMCYLILLYANSRSVCNQSAKSEVEIALSNGDLPQSVSLAEIG